jgi:hypothetical protein
MGNPLKPKFEQSCYSLIEYRMVRIVTGPWADKE